jgi:predicted phage-related endonuclease
MLTQESRERRRTVAGSSDAAGILGLSPWTNRRGVYWSKVAMSTDEPDEAQELGDDVQPMLCDWAARQVGSDYEPDVWAASPDGLPIAATLDGLIEGKPERIIEAKSTSMPGEWGDPSVPNSLPACYLVQCAVQLHCRPNAEEVLVPRFSGVPTPGGGYRIGRKLYRAVRDDAMTDLIAEVVEQCTDFMRRYVFAGIEPPDELPPPLETMKRIVREPASTIEVHDDAALARVEAWHQTVEAKRVAERAEERAKAAVLADMGTAEEMICGPFRLRYILEGTEHPVTYIYKPRRVLRSKSNKENHP